MRTELSDYDKGKHRHRAITPKEAKIRLGRSPVERYAGHYKIHLCTGWLWAGSYRDKDGMRHDVRLRVVYTPEEAVEAVKEEVGKFPVSDLVELCYHPSSDGDLSARVWVVMCNFGATPAEAMDVAERIRDACATAKRCNAFLDYAEKTCKHARKGAVEARNDE